MNMTVSRTIFTRQEVPANALDVSPDKKQVVIAGRSIFKVFSIDPERGFVEGINLRSGHRHINLNYSCTDVSWNRLDEDYVATAATNGAVVIWRLNNDPKARQERVFSEHKRTANKVNFHPMDHNLLLSGSQDATIKLFDIRLQDSTSTFTSTNESVRDVQFSPHNQFGFVSAMENGIVSVWDLRRTDKPEKTWPAHSDFVISCDWHPEVRNWLATGSRDKTVKIWKCGEGKPVLDTLIYTLASVGNVRWRPGNKAQIATTSVALDFNINVWDIRRPYVPHALFDSHKDVTNDIVWRDLNTMVSTSRDGTLYQHSFADAKNPCNHANPVALAININGELTQAQRNKKPNANVKPASEIDRQIVATQGAYYIPHPPPMPPLPSGVSAGMSNNSSNNSSNSNLVNIVNTTSGVSTGVAATVATTAAGIGTAGNVTSPMGNLQQQMVLQGQQHHGHPQHQTNSHHQHTRTASHGGQMGGSRMSPAERYRRSSPDFARQSPESSAAWKTVTYRSKRRSKVEVDDFVVSRSNHRFYKISNKVDASTSTNLSYQSLFKDNSVRALTSMDWFVFSAKNYILSDPSFTKLCNHNASVASALNRIEVSKTWKSLKILYGHFESDKKQTLMGKYRNPSVAANLGKENKKERRRTNDESSASNGRTRHGSTKSAKSRMMPGKGKRDPMESLLSRRGSRGFDRSGSSTSNKKEDYLNSSEESESDDNADVDNDVTLTNIASGQMLLGNLDFFGDTEFNSLATSGIEKFVHTDEDKEMKMRNDWPLRNEAFELRHEIKDSLTHDEAAEQFPFGGGRDASQNLESDGMQKSLTNSDDLTQSILKIRSDYEIYPTWSPDRSVANILKYYAEAGDIQTTVAMYLVLGHERCKNFFDEATLEFWFQSYVELLQRYKLMNQAIQLIKLCPLTTIQQTNVHQTTYLSNCTTCKRALNHSKGAWFCNRCHRSPTVCACCHRTVKGLLVWCQGCGHGGDVAHISKWFKKHRRCPAGCGHFCQFQ